jgi:putative oxidoreductase
MTPSTSTQTTVTLVGRALLAMLFIPAGWAKIAGFSGVVGYIASKGVPLPEVAAAIAIAASACCCCSG